MRSITQPTTPRTPAPKAYYAHLYEEQGVLTRLLSGEIVFRAEATGMVTTIEPEMIDFLSVGGEVGLSDCQWLMDHRFGTLAHLVDRRQSEHAAIA
jgi:hypothetical protein